VTEERKLFSNGHWKGGCWTSRSCHQVSISPPYPQLYIYIMYLIFWDWKSGSLFTDRK